MIVVINKKCKKCNQILPADSFHKCAKEKDGLQYYCKLCHSEYVSKNKRKIKENKKSHYIENKDKYIKKAKKWCQENRGESNRIKKDWCEKNPEKVKKIEKEKNKKQAKMGLKRVWSAKYRASKLKRIPSWSDLGAIKLFYKNCPNGMVVDHIIPLQGETISGLHVLENLQYLTPVENSSKGNKYAAE